MSDVIKGDLIEGSHDPSKPTDDDHDDILIGDGDNDTLIGSDGYDTFVFGDGFDHEVVLDFDPAQDRLELRTKDIEDWDDFQARLSADEDGNALLTLEDGSTLLLVGVEPGDITQESVYLWKKPIPCFASGTLIRTARGEVAVEDLRVGDLVVSRDRGLVPIRWIGSRRLGAQYLRHSPDFRPVNIAAGALGSGHPATDLVVSPEHRVILGGPVVQLCFGESEVLAAAKDLVGQPGITRERPEGVTYYHLLFDAHEIIESQGAWTESFQPSGDHIDCLDERARAEILALFPQLSCQPQRKQMPVARSVLAAHETRSLMTMRREGRTHDLTPSNRRDMAA